MRREDSVDKSKLQRSAADPRADCIGSVESDKEIKPRVVTTLSGYVADRQSRRPIFQKRGVRVASASGDRQGVEGESPLR